jgi:hypothetical protein
MYCLRTISYFAFRKIFVFSFIIVVKIKQFLFRSEQALWLQEDEALRISREFAHKKEVSSSALGTGPLYHPTRNPGV